MHVLFAGVVEDAILLQELTEPLGFGRRRSFDIGDLLPMSEVDARLRERAEVQRFRHHRKEDDEQHGQRTKRNGDEGDLTEAGLLSARREVRVEDRLVALGHRPNREDPDTIGMEIARMARQRRSRRLRASR